MRRALKGGKCSPKLSSQLIVYTLATAFSINPVEVYEMPASLIIDMLIIHKNMKELEAEEMEKASKGAKL